MTKHPILSGFVTALVLSVVLAFVMPCTTQESSWALFFIALLFPFLWFMTFRRARC